MDTNKINDLTKHLKEVGYQLSLLLVEDDEMLRNQLKRFLSKFFNTIDTANNGLEALERYSNRDYDLIITDLTMPIMNGLELAKKIRETSETQNILVVSAHSDSEKLLDLINIGVDGFLLKPVNMEIFLNQLNKICQAIYNQKILNHYSDLLEDTNRELAQKNRELDLALKGLVKTKETPPSPVKKENATVAAKKEEVISAAKIPKMSAENFHASFPFELEKTSEDLEVLESKFNLALSRSKKDLQDEELYQFIDILRRYARVLEMNPQFGGLSYGIQELARTFASIEDPKKLKSILPMLTSLFDNLEQWRISIFQDRDTDDIHYMDDSIISDALSLQNMLDAQNNPPDSSFDEMELF